MLKFGIGSSFSEIRRQAPPPRNPGGCYVDAPTRDAVLICHSALHQAGSSVTFSDGTFLNGDWTATKDLDSTPSSNATFAAYQVLYRGNPGAFRETDHVWTGPGGFVVDQFQVVAVYNPAVNGPVVAINSSFDLKFCGRFRRDVPGSATRSSSSRRLRVLFTKEPRRRAGPRNGLPGPWLSFGSFGLTAADFSFSWTGPCDSRLLLGRRSHPIWIPDNERQ